MTKGSKPTDNVSIAQLKQRFLNSRNYTRQFDVDQNTWIVNRIQTPTPLANNAIADNTVLPKSSISLAAAKKDTTKGAQSSSNAKEIAIRKIQDQLAVFKQKLLAADTSTKNYDQLLDRCGNLSQLLEKMLV